MENNITYSLIPMKLYDNSLDENLSMYDHLPYKRDETLCNRSSVKLISGNLIKYYRCKFASPYIVDFDMKGYKNT